MAITSQPRQAGFPLTQEIGTGGLPKRSWVKISQVRTLAAERIGKKIAHLTPEELANVVDALNEIVGD